MKLPHNRQNKSKKQQIITFLKFVALLGGLFLIRLSVGSIALVNPTNVIAGDTLKAYLLKRIRRIRQFFGIAASAAIFFIIMKKTKESNNGSVVYNT